MNKWSTLPPQKIINKTVISLTNNNFNVYVVDTQKEAKNKFFEILPLGAEILNNTSQTLTSIGISQEIQESGKYNAIKNKLLKMDRLTQSKEMKKLGSVPDWSAGSAQAVTEDGQIVIASNTGSQIPGYAYGADHVILVIGTNKIVKNINDGIKRVYEHSLKLESKRINKAIGIPRSYVRRLFILEEEANPNRTSIILVNQELGF